MGILRNVGSFVSSLFKEGKVSYRSSESPTVTQSNAKPSEPLPPQKPPEAQLTSFPSTPIQTSPFYPASWSRAQANFATSSDPLPFSYTKVKGGGVFVPRTLDVVTNISGAFDVDGTSIQLTFTLSKTRLTGNSMGTITQEQLPDDVLEPITVSGVDCLS